MTISTTDEPIRLLPVDRRRAFLRFILWSVPAVLCAVAAIPIYSNLHFVPTAVSNRLVDYAVALLAAPLPIIALGCAWRALCWLLTAAWPGELGIWATDNELILRLGPFGTRRYDAARLDIRYPFELSLDDEGPTFESFLPEEQQIEKFLPRIRHPAARESINLTILRFAPGAEPNVAAALRERLESWRKNAKL